MTEERVPLPSFLPSFLLFYLPSLPSFPLPFGKKGKGEGKEGGREGWGKGRERGVGCVYVCVLCPPCSGYNVTCVCVCTCLTGIIRLGICVYVCMCVCMYVCMYVVCVYMCIYICVCVSVSK
jgi:hypothetical protein